MKLPRQMICLLGTLLALLLGLPAHAARLALVIGNKDYKVGALKNPVNDAQAMSQTLTELGFAVTTVKNLRRDDIGRTVDGFASRIKAGDDVVVFYAGHGVQVKGVNYLPAVDANIAVESDVALNSLNLNQLLDRLDEAKSGVRLLLIDACRDNPYSRSFRSGSRGLARVEGAPSGTLMHFATRPGGVAADGSAANGLYTSELLKHLKTPGLSVESMLKRVAAGVKQASSGDQQPWTEGALDGEFYFAPAGNAPAPPPVQIASVQPEPVVPSAPQANPRPSGPPTNTLPDIGRSLHIETFKITPDQVEPGGMLSIEAAYTLESAQISEQKVEVTEMRSVQFYDTRNGIWRILGTEKIPVFLMLKSGSNPHRSLGQTRLPTEVAEGRYRVIFAVSALGEEKQSSYELIVKKSQP